MTDDSTAETRESSIDAAVVDRAAEAAAVTADELADVLVVLDAELLGRHSTYEADGEYVTAEGRRAYLVGDDEWESLAADVGIDDPLAAAARRAHDEQARALFEEAGQADRVDRDETGIVVGVDTAEEMI
ncbi:hypothetical protein [Halegenticoccus tardaugens]|uniref:hypothetical protein n=1 Tax=Halegenticoccus tardaugens TaxID=2071624 RepID=UPI00100B65EA|nr:hypothetical protein [Halegenticoccus tardaugens]